MDGVFQLYGELGIRLLERAADKLLDAFTLFAGDRWMVAIERARIRDFYFLAERIEGFASEESLTARRISHASHISRTCSLWSRSVDLLEGREWSIRRFPFMH